MLPVRRRQACVSSPVPTLPLPSHAFLAPGGKGVGRQISATLYGFPLATYPFRLEVTTSFVSAAARAFPASRTMNLTSLFSFPAVHKALDSSQQQAGWASVSLGGRLEKNPHKPSILFSCLESGFLFQVQEPEIYLRKIKSYVPNKKHTLSIPSSKTIKTPLEKREGKHPELPLISPLKSQVSLDEIRKCKHILLFFLSKFSLLNIYGVVCSDFSDFSKATLFNPYFSPRQLFSFSANIP